MVPTSPAIRDTQGNMVTLTPQQQAMYNAEKQAQMAQDQAKKEAMAKALIQHQAQQEEAYSTAFANRDANDAIEQGLSNAEKE
jgi:hypothetical protein